jgi:hypothetical protein
MHTFIEGARSQPHCQRSYPGHSTLPDCADNGLDGDRTMDLSFAASSDGVIGHQLGDEEFFSGAGELNSAADTVRQGNQVF